MLLGRNAQQVKFIICTCYMNFQLNSISGCSLIPYIFSISFRYSSIGGNPILDEVYLRHFHLELDQTQVRHLRFELECRIFAFYLELGILDPLTTRHAVQ